MSNEQFSLQYQLILLISTQMGHFLFFQLSIYRLRNKLLSISFPLGLFQKLQHFSSFPDER